MIVYLVTHITGRSELDYGSYAKIVGIYTTKTKAIKARANYTQEFAGYDLSNYKKKTWHCPDEYEGFIEIETIQLDDERYLPEEK
jgi:hypothetical protein